MASQRELEISSVTGQPAAHMDWWQNPLNVLKGSDLHPKDHSIQIFTNASNVGLGCLFRSKLREKSVVRRGKKARHKCTRTTQSPNSLIVPCLKVLLSVSLDRACTSRNHFFFVRTFMNCGAV